MTCAHVVVCMLVILEKSESVRLSILKRQEIKTRVFLLSGRKAFVYLNHIQQENSKISKLLSAKPLELSSAVRDLGQRYLDLQKSYRQLSTEIMLRMQNKFLCMMRFYILPY